MRAKCNDCAFVYKDTSVTYTSVNLRTGFAAILNSALSLMAIA